MTTFLLSPSRWVHYGSMLLVSILLAFIAPGHARVFFLILSGMFFLECGTIYGKGFVAFPNRSLARYRLKNPDAGRWLEAPVAELDKSTIGKLLASRASRDPGLHVVVRHSPPPICSDALYDHDIDG